MFVPARANILVFSHLIQNRRNYVSQLSKIEMSVDLFSNEQRIVAAAVKSDVPILVDLDTSEWVLSIWLETLVAEGVSTQAVFLTETKQSKMIERFNRPTDTNAAFVDFFCTRPEVLFRNSGKEFLRVLDSFNAVVCPT